MKHLAIAPTLVITFLAAGCSSGIHDAARVGDTAEIRRLVEAKRSRIDQQDRHGNTPLHLAAMYRQGDTVAALLDMGADCELPRPDGLTAIDLAREGRQRSQGTWAEDQKRAIHDSRLQSDTKLGRLMTIERLYGPGALPQWESIVDRLEKSYLTVAGPDGRRYPVITRVRGGVGSAPWAGSANDITIAAGPKGPMYTVRNSSQVLVRNATVEELQASHPRLHEQLKNRYAADRQAVADVQPSATRDFTLTPQFKPAAIPHADDGQWGHFLQPREKE